MLSVRRGRRRWHSDATSRHSPSSANGPERPGVGWMEGWGPRDSPVRGQLHQLPHPAAFEHSLLRGAGVEHGAEAKGGIVPGLGTAYLGTAAAQGVPQHPRTPPGAGTYVHGAVTEAVHNLLVTSPRLRAGQWPDPNVGCGWGHRGVAAWGPWAALL